MRAQRFSTWLLGFCLLAAGGRAEEPRAPEYLVIVNTANPASGAERKFLSDAFLKKTTRWSGGQLLQPVDQRSDSAVRRHFSEQVLERSVTAVRSYWQQVIFSGRDVPPPELSSDGSVLEYVRNHSGAVGYVSGNASTAGAKVLAVR
jgi:ABC-type phosphate transport system substrate-binding protein